MMDQRKRTLQAIADGFGGSVALSGSTALIGVDRESSRIGAVYVFTGSGGAWIQQAELMASDGGRSRGFGASVALSGTTAVVGTDRPDSDGAVYLFAESGGTWTQQAKLTASVS